MFFSLSKKILLTILAFLGLSAFLFVIFFDNVIGKKIRNEQKNFTLNLYHGILDNLNNCHDENK